MSAPNVIFFWAIVGVAVGALITALVAWYQLVARQREHRYHLRRREGTIDRLKNTIKDQGDRLHRQGEQIHELYAIRAERATLTGDLERTHRSLAELQATLESVRATARETELRLNAALDTERQEGLARRAVSASELAAAQESALSLRAELASTREAASRLSTRLEADLATARSLLERTSQELQNERNAALEARADLTRRIAALDDDRLRLETELSGERRANAEKQASLRSFVSTLREQYALACAERDSVMREVELHRSRATELASRLERARDEFSHRLDTEHEESVELISRVWDYVHNYPRLRERPIHGPPPHPESDIPRPVTPADAAPPPEQLDLGVPAPPPAAPPSAPQPSAPPGVPGAVATDREVPAAPNILADVALPRASTEQRGGEAARAVAGEMAAREREAGEAAARSMGGAEYDIERALSESQPHTERRTVPGFPTGTKVRRPVSAMRRDHDVLVICDDGSVWTKRPNGWTEELPIPGSEVEASQRLDDESKRSD